MRYFVAYVLCIAFLFATAAPASGIADSPPWTIQFTPGEYRLPRETYIKWVQKSAAAVTHYFGKFPVRNLIIRIISTSGDDVGYSSADNEDGTPVIELRVGRDISSSDLLSSWEATHEMVHLAFPLVDDDNKWVAEGMATYIEPLARMQIGDLTREHIWGDLVINLPRGLRERPKGFRNAGTIDSYYWGGALFCLLADVEIREKTHNKFGLEDALAAIPAHGITIASDTEVPDAFRVGDEAIGVPVLLPLYKRFYNEPVDVDLASLWNRLGVHREGGHVTFDDTAPLASIRRAIDKGVR